MRNSMLSLLFVFCASFAACGGSSGPPPPLNPTLLRNSESPARMATKDSGRDPIEFAKTDRCEDEKLVPAILKRFIKNKRVRGGS
jgi:hypothetical protein